MKDIILHDILIPSLKRLYQEDYNNIKYGVSERNICARLAHHMENVMREYDAKNRTSFVRLIMQMSSTTEWVMVI